ncbi:hypothetical protein, partial [Photobacterium kishitanii]|uniref:hypothetical protein n=1 Tax=Photobacterium kishitanii TaxID=318456 RepID=UPI001F2B2934
SFTVLVYIRKFHEERYCHRPYKLIRIEYPSNNLGNNLLKMAVFNIHGRPNLPSTHALKNQTS